MAGVGHVEIFAGFVGGEAFGVDGGMEDGGVAVVVFFDAAGGFGGVGEKEIDVLGGAVVGAFEGWNHEWHGEADEKIELAEAGVFFVFAVV